MKLSNSGDYRYLKLAAIILAIAPILDPYVLADISGIDFRLMYFVALIGVLLIFIIQGKIRVNGELLVLVSIISLLTLISFFAGVNNRNFYLAIKNILIWVCLSGIVGVLWANFKHDYFVKCVYAIGIIAVLVLFFQFICLNIGITSVFDGKIPFLNLSKYDDWSPMYNAVGNIRGHSFFQEPSYLSIFLLPLFADSIERRKYVYTLIFLISIFISTSSVGICGVIIVVIYNIIKKSNTENTKRKLQLVFSMIGLLVIVYLLYSLNDNIRSTIDFSVNKIMSMQSDLESSRLGSTKLRLIGHANLFSDLNWFFKVFGLGANQYVDYYGLTISYSSTIVTILLNYGVLGIIGFSIWLIYLNKKYCKDNKAYLFIFIMICCVDQFWFNWYFFYVLSWIIMRHNRVGKEIKNVDYIGNSASL